MNKVLFSSLILCAVLGSVSVGVVRRVPSEYPSIQRAIDDCNDGDTVIVSPGVYYETINFGGRNIVVTGTDPNDPKIVGYTIINADGDGTVVTFENRETEEAVLTGFTITGGLGTLAQWSSEDYKYFQGAGIYCNGAWPTITRNVITNNHGPYSEQLVNDRWTYVYSEGGGICCSGGAIVTHNLIYNNSAYAGGGIYAGRSTVANNVICDNSAYMGGGVYIYYGSLVNNTIVGNDCSKDPEWGRGGNVYASFSYYDNLIVVNNNICGAGSGGGLFYGIRPRGDLIRFNNVWNNAPADYGFQDPRTYDNIYGEEADWTGLYGNISADPLFVDPWNKNYHLQPTSPCVSAGDPSFPWAAGAQDIDGDPRVFAVRADIGADEHVGYVRPLAHAGTDQHVLTPGPVTLDASGSYFSDPAGPTTYQWSQVEGPAVELSDSAARKPSFTPPVESWYTFELVVGDGQHTSDPDRVLVVVGNERPVANAGPDRLWPVPGRIRLDGTRSSDADPPDKLTYMWTQMEGPGVALMEPNSPTPYFDCNEPGIYVFTLAVGDGFEVSGLDTVKLRASAWTLNAEGFSVTDYSLGRFYYPDVAGPKVVCAGGTSSSHTTWTINCLDLQTGRLDTFEGSSIDTMPKVDGGRVVWAGAAVSSGYPCTSLFLSDLITGQIDILRMGSASESYGYPAISGNKVVWAQHLGVDNRDEIRYLEAPYDICGADITDPKRPVYFTIVEQVGRRAPYPYFESYTNDHVDFVDICGDIVVWEGNGDIFGADISDLNDIRVFPICTAPERQYNPAVSGNVVVWTDERNDIGDIYGADISDRDDVREFEVAVEPGWQSGADIDGAVIAWHDGDDYYGTIQVCCLSKEYGPVRFPLVQSQEFYNYYGSGLEIDGSTIIWQYGSRIRGLTFDFAYSVTEGPVRNLTTGRYHDYLQHAIDAGTDGDVIVVEPGVYAEKVRLKGKNVTVTSADPEDPVVRAATVIAGPGQRVSFADGETADCVFTGFTVSGGSYGIFCGGSAPTISNCTIENNTSAGLKLWNQSNPTVSRCEVAGNGLGVEMWAHGDTRTILRNFATFRNCLVAGSRGDGIYGNNPTLENCTVADNGGYGVSCSLAQIINSIVYFNNEGEANLKLKNARSTVTYSDVQGGWPGAGNIDADPQFVARGLGTAPAEPSVAPGPIRDAAWVAGDYHLKSQGWSWDAERGEWTFHDVTSPCIDAGDPATPVGDEQPCGPGDPLSARAAPNIRINMGVYGGTAEASLAPHAETEEP